MTRLDRSAATVLRLCQLAQLPRATYYRSFEAKAPRAADMEMRSLIHAVSLANRHYGYRRITHALRRQGVAVNGKRVQRLMREDNLIAQRRKPFIPPPADRGQSMLIVPNLVRGLVPTGLDQIWVADITYVRLLEAFAYLAVILDAFSRKVVGWAFEPSLDAEVALRALQRAIGLRRPPPGSLIHHSDRGVQYASIEYRKRLDAHAIEPSMSRPGNPYDNAKAESFMKTLKAEEVDGKRFRNIAHARSDIGFFIDTVYNTERLHSALGYSPPLEFETNFTLSKTT